MFFIKKQSFIATTLGINSGLCYAFLVSTFTAYLVDLHINLAMIGFLSLRTIPYSFKFLWAPIVDSFVFARLARYGKRRSWLIFAQMLLILTLLSMSFIDAKDNVYLITTLTFVMSFIAATYDIAMESYRISLGKDGDDAHVNSLVILGFRLGFIISGALCLYLSSFIDWAWVFRLIALAIFCCMLIIITTAEESAVTSSELSTKNWFKNNVLVPFGLLFRIPNFALVLLVISFYKVSDGYVDNMLVPFLFEMGYSKADIAGISKTVGLVATILGTFAGAVMIRHFALLKNLLIAELLAASTNLLFIILISPATDDKLLTLVIMIENFCAGISNIALITYMSSICKHAKFTATHFAILVSISGLLRAILGSSSGFIVTEFGWMKFFMISSALSIPSLLCLLLLRLRNKKNFTISDA